MEQADLTTGNVRQRLLEFALPFFLANLMQATYGAMDLFTVGRFTSTSAVSSVNIGSQAMQLVTVFVTGIFLGTTVSIGGAIGMDDRKREKSAILSSRRILAAAATALTALLLLLIRPLIGWMQTPEEAVNETATYLHICVFGIPFIAIFNCYAAILRGHGDSRRPMQAVFMACVTNIAGDLILTGAMGLGVTGVAIATVSAQGMSALGAWIFARQAVHESSTAPDAENQPGLCRQILKIGIPIAMQDTLINISFMILTLVANRCWCRRKTDLLYVPGSVCHAVCGDYIYRTESRCRKTRSRAGGCPHRNSGDCAVWCPHVPLQLVIPVRADLRIHP